MKVICDRGALLESLNLVGGVVAARTPKPALQCVKITAAEAQLTLAGTDTEVALRLTSPRVDVQEPGEALVPAEKLRQIVSESQDPTLTIETEGDVTHVVAADSKFKVFGQPVGDFPPIPEIKGEADFEVPAGELHRIIAMTLFATARENSRYAINGVLIERDSNKLTVVATDGHRLAMAKGSCKAKKGEARNAIVPSKALNLLLRLFSDAEQVVMVQIAENQIHFSTEAAVLTSNLVEGNFPPYKDVIPKDGDKKATLATDVFISGVRRAALLTNEESKGVRMAFGKSGLVLSSRAPEMGEAEVRVELADYSGDELEIGFNPGYLLDALKVVDANDVLLEMKAANKPGVLRSGSNFLYVVMPVNLQ
ncbi:MAG: DNA polymerase III subunit beta [Phycisphaeraceae bacterium]|nr:DNA polymerase III subunit beta [Phycisphaeraceae bacterium]